MRKRSKLDNFRPAEFVILTVPIFCFIVVWDAVRWLLGYRSSAR